MTSDLNVICHLRGYGGIFFVASHLQKVGYSVNLRQFFKIDGSFFSFLGNKVLVTGANTKPLLEVKILFISLCRHKTHFMSIFMVVTRRKILDYTLMAISD